MSGTSYRIVLHAAVPKEIRTLPAKVKKRVKEAIDRLSDDPVPAGAIRLKGRVNAYRLRFGDYRMLYEIHATEIVVYVVSVAHRKELYRHLRRKSRKSE